LPLSVGTAKSSDAMAKIQFTTPEGATGEIELSAERLTLGRADDNSIVIPHESVSSHHGEFVFDGAAWIFTDLGSTNGTSVSGQRVESLEMASGGAFNIGHIECVFYGDGEVAETPAYAAPSRTMTSGGYGDTPIDRSRRQGFGPKSKPKGHGYGIFYLMAVVALAVCGYAAFTFMNLSA